MPSDSARAEGWSPANLPVPTIKLGASVGGAVVSNLVGIPLDRFRILVAQDFSSSRALSYWLGETFASPKKAFVGGSARVTMKIMATAANLYIPVEFREAYPFLSNFAVGAGLSPLFNIPRVFQLNKISGTPYPQTLKSTFLSVKGLKGYAHNTLLWGPGEGFRMMICFGCKDWIMPRIGGNADPTQVTPSLHTFKMALIAGPSIALVESTVAVLTETVSTIQAHIKTTKAAPGQHESFTQVLKSTITPKYSFRCWASLTFKNCFTNTALFWLMFASDFYTKLAKVREAKLKL